MIQLIAFIIFLLSLAGIVFILGRKAPILVKLPQNGHHGIKKPDVLLKLEQKIKEHHFHLFKRPMWLQRILSFTKIWILRSERKIDHMSQVIRKKVQQADKETKKKK